VKKRRAVLLAPLLVAGLGIAACGDDDGSDVRNIDGDSGSGSGSGSDTGSEGGSGSESGSGTAPSSESGTTRP
jgi:hypothetical protein